MSSELTQIPTGTSILPALFAVFLIIAGPPCDLAISL